jgi:hypothetical protein
MLTQTHVNSQHIAHRHNLQSLVESLDDKKKNMKTEQKVLGKSGKTWRLDHYH